MVKLYSTYDTIQTPPSKQQIMPSFLPCTQACTGFEYIFVDYVGVQRFRILCLGIPIMILRYLLLQNVIPKLWLVGADSFVAHDQCLARVVPSNNMKASDTCARFLVRRKVGTKFSAQQLLVKWNDHLVQEV